MRNRYISATITQLCILPSRLGRFLTAKCFVKLSFRLAPDLFFPEKILSVSKNTKKTNTQINISLNLLSTKTLNSKRKMRYLTSLTQTIYIAQCRIQHNNKIILFFSPSFFCCLLGEAESTGPPFRF